MLHVLYLVHDLLDPAVRRRVAMFQAGGASVTLAGFCRGPAPADIAGTTPILLGTTKDGAFAQRIAAVMRAAVRLGKALRSIRRPDVIVGRHLEMLALANRAVRLFGGNVPIVYESLDIHRLLLRGDGIGRAMRSAERLFGRQAALLMTSSPAFVREYFEPRGHLAAPILLVENKVLELDGADGEAVGDLALPRLVEPGEPWRIGWFGALRCRRSLELLAGFTHRMEGRCEIVLRGRPAYSEFDDFDGFLAAEPHLHFHGAYRNPEDLAAIYGEVHFAWAVDFFEEGLNSSWLLPNRLYESCRYGVVPIAVQGTETARFLEQRQMGLVFAEPSVDALAALFEAFVAERYAEERQRVARHERRTWICDRAGCTELVDQLRAVAGRTTPGPALEVMG
ncbi:glycosyl transferase family 1 [Consotaella aegiceratis]|uniref:glycosyl transferase family 1 n=1 Tax=Consotaella aegiceratis TaxID=3097961 RepID=UPI002F3E84E6